MPPTKNYGKKEEEEEEAGEVENWAGLKAWKTGNLGIWSFSQKLQIPRLLMK